LSLKLTIELKGTKDDTLLNLLVMAHQKAARDNPNASAELCRIATEGSGDFTKGLIAALATTGGAHAPLAAARKVWKDGLNDDHWDGEKVPGFGNSFYKDIIDPAFVPVVTYIRDKYYTEYKELAHLKADVKKYTGKDLQPNAAILTAMVCEILEIPEGMEILVFLLARAPVWAEKSFDRTV
jgi:citrate synthase